MECRGVIQWLEKVSVSKEGTFKLTVIREPARPVGGKNTPDLGNRMCKVPKKKDL